MSIGIKSEVFPSANIKMKIMVNPISFRYKLFGYFFMYVFDIM